MASRGHSGGLEKDKSLLENLVRVVRTRKIKLFQ